MNASVPAISSGTDIHQEPVSCSPKAAIASPTKITICTSAISTVTTTRAATTERGGDRGEPQPPQQLAVAPALPAWRPPRTPRSIATAQPSRPGVTNWMVFSDLSSTRSVASVYGAAARRRPGWRRRRTR